MFFRKILDIMRIIFVILCPYILMLESLKTNTCFWKEKLSLNYRLSFKRIFAFKMHWINLQSLMKKVWTLIIAPYKFFMDKSKAFFALQVNGKWNSESQQERHCDKNVFFLKTLETIKYKNYGNIQIWENLEIYTK